MPRPKGPYRVDPGKDTEGGKYSKSWRDYITLEKDKEKREIAKNGRPTDRTVPRNGRTDENWSKAVMEKRYWGMDWRDLYLLRNTPKPPMAGRSITSILRTGAVMMTCRT